MAKKEKEPLTPEVVQDIVVENTPEHPKDPAPNTQLRTLGIVDDETAATHKAGIRSDIKGLGFTIKQSAIKSSPTTTIAACRNSVLNNAS